MTRFTFERLDAGTLDEAAVLEGPVAEQVMGQVLDRRYGIQGLLGEGGMAEVFEAFDMQEQRRVAIKLLSKTRRGSSDLQRRLLLEAEVTTTISHPNVVRLFDTGQTEDGHPYIVMEVLEGETLHDLLERDGALGVDEALAFARQIAAGLEAAHAEGVVHRDIKPRNVFLCGPPGRAESVKVFDFGFARNLTERNSSGHVLGTLEYMAPEQIVSEPADGRADVYSLGVVMFRMLTRELPFDTGPRKQILAHQMISTAPPASWLVDELDPRIDQVIQTAMRKCPTNRYATMSDMREDIERLANGRDILGAPLMREPDHYVPLTDLGNTALQLLRSHYGVT